MCAAKGALISAEASAKARAAMLEAVPRMMAAHSVRGSNGARGSKEQRHCHAQAVRRTRSAGNAQQIMFERREGKCSVIVHDNAPCAMKAGAAAEARVNAAPPRYKQRCLRAERQRCAKHLMFFFFF